MPVVEAEKKIKLARTFNIISIVWGVLYFIFAFIVGFLAGLAEAFAFMLARAAEMGLTPKED
jgi:hypothetical protein